MKSIRSLAFVAAFAIMPFASASHADTALPAAHPVGPIGNVTVFDMVDVLGSVVSVDQAKRLVTLKGPDDKDFVIHASDEVANLPQVKDGDIVTLSYRSALVEDMMKAAPNAKPSLTVDDAVLRAKHGEKPAAENIRIVTLTGEIVHIDAATSTVVILGPLGETHTVKVQKDDHKKLLSDLKTDDMIQVTYAEAIKLAVSAPPAK